MDIILDSHLCPEIFCQRMNDALPDGIMLLKAVEVGESLPSLMSLIDRAVYLITVHNPPKDIDIKLNRFLQQNEIVIKKTVKGGNGLSI